MRGPTVDDIFLGRKCAKWMDRDSSHMTLPQFEENQGSEAADRSVEAGDPSGEHALFVLLGIVSTVGVLLHGLGLL